MEISLFRRKLTNAGATALVAAAGLLLIALYWSSRPLGRMRLVHAIELVTFPVIHKTPVITDSEQENAKNAQEVPVLLYHGIFDGPTDDGFNITKEAFIDQMVTLKRNGYTTLSMSQYLRFLEGKLEVPAKSVLITFDDGRKDSYYRADTILNALHFKAVMFLASGYSLVDGSNYYVDKDEVRHMHESGRWDIEAHADYAGTNQIIIDQEGERGNFFGNLQWNPDEMRQETIEEYRQRVSDEMRVARDKLEEFIRPDIQNIFSFAFPFGDYAQGNEDDRLRTVLLEEARKLYKQVFVQFRKGEPYSSNYKISGVFVSRRIEVDPRMSGADLYGLLASATAKPLPYEAEFTKNEGWKADWGEVKVSEGASVMLRAEGGTSAAMYLDGTRQLMNYNVSTTVSIDSPDTVFKLIAPYVDGRNYIGCNYNSNSVKIEQLIDGVRSVLAQTAYDYSPTDGKRTELGIRLGSQNSIECYASDALILSGTYQGNYFGGPAVTVWNAKTGVARADVSSFRLDEIDE